MTQVPASSRGLPLTGGTLTGPLTIAPSSNSGGSSLLNIFPPSDTPGGAFVVNIDDKDGNLTQALFGNGDVQFLQGAIELEPTTFRLQASHAPTAPGYRSNAFGYTSIANNAAPADGDLVAGELAFWFDPTNGVSKFMLKGKSLNGIVVTAAVLLA